jgi:ribosome-associated protein
MRSTRSKKPAGKSKSKTRSVTRAQAVRADAQTVKKKRGKKTQPIARLVVKNVSPVKRQHPAADSVVVGIVARALDDMKAVNVKKLDVRGQTDIADTLFIVSGNSDRHVRAIADRVVEFAKKAGFRPMGVEGERDGEWVLVDLQDVIVHVMLPRVREFYRLESLWDVTAARREAAGH